MGDEYEDDDFEDYDDDDFEEEEEEAAPQPPPQKPAANSQKSSAKPAPSKAPSPKSAKSPVKDPAEIAAHKEAAAESMLLNHVAQIKLKEGKKDDPPTPKHLPDHVLEMRRAVHEENQKVAAKSPPRDKDRKQSSVRSSRSNYSPERLRPRTAKRDPSPSPEEEEDYGPIPSYSGGGRTFVEPNMGADGRVVLKSDLSGVGKLRRQRYKDLVKSEKIKLTSSETVLMLEMKPMSEYDLFARGFSRVDKDSTASQVPDDDRQRIAETQSDPITKSNVSLQVPDDTGVRSTYEKAQHREIVRQGGGLDGVGAMGYDSSRLSAFLLRVEPVVSALLHESAREQFSRQSSLKRFGDEVLKDSATSFSATSISFTASFKGVLKGRSISRIAVVGSDSDYIAVCYGPKLDPTASDDGGQGDAEDLAGLGLVCLWKRTSPDSPAHTLATHLTPSSFAFSPVSSAPLCVVGSREGILSLWDLREASIASSPLHRKTAALLSATDQDQAPAEPTGTRKWRLANYTTTYCNPNSLDVQIQPTSGYFSGDDDDDAPPSRKTNSKSRGRNSGQQSDVHVAPVIEVRVIVSDERAGRSDDSLGVQVVSLDEEGKFLFWSVIALQDDDDDMFLSYGGRMKLLRIAAASIHKDLSLAQRDKLWTVPLARCLCEHPLDGNLFFVGLENGDVLQRARYGKPPRPAKYRVHGYQSEVSAADFGHYGFDSVTAVTSIAVSSFRGLAPDASALLMLVGREDGSVSLYSTSSPSPLRSWSGFALGAVVFIVLDSTSRLYFFILLDKGNDGPVQVEHVDSSHVLQMDVGAANQGTPKQRTNLAVAFQSGHIQVHELKSKFSEPMSKEEDDIRSVIASWI